MCVCLGLAACVEDNPAFDPDRDTQDGGEEEEGCAEGQEITQTIPALEDPRQLDVLVVLSDAPGADALQQRVSAAMPGFVRSLDDAGLDWHLGFVAGGTTSSANQGTLRANTTASPECSSAPRVVTTGGQAGVYAACNALVGTNGSHIQEPMAAALTALTTRAAEPAESGGNAGFLRPRARLLVVFASDRDDCSGQGGAAIGASARRAATDCALLSNTRLTPVEQVAQQLGALKNDPSAVSVAVLGGSDDGKTITPEEAQEPSCMDAQGNAVYPATRMIELSDLFAPGGEFESACASSFGLSFEHIARLLEAGSVELCPRSQVVDPALTVVRVQGDERVDVELGAEGYLYLGPTDACPNGAVRLHPSVLSGLTGSIELRYCTP